MRNAFARGGTPVRLLGLAAGMWDLRIDAHDMEYRRTVTVDGVTDVSLSLTDG